MLTNNCLRLLSHKRKKILFISHLKYLIAYKTPIFIIYVIYLWKLNCLFYSILFFYLPLVGTINANPSINHLFADIYMGFFVLLIFFTNKDLVCFAIWFVIFYYKFWRVNRSQIYILIISIPFSTFFVNL